MIKTQFSLHDITETMIVYGGGFVSQLGRLIRLADDDNTRRLVEAFPEYIQQYDELAATRSKGESHV
jgi:hypothetical protein